MNDSETADCLLLTERVNVSNGKQVLASNGDSGSLQPSFYNVVDESWKWRNAADEERGHCTPVAAKLWRVAVYAVKVIHVWNRDIASADEEVVGDQDRGHWAQEDGVTTQESEELGSRCEDLPRDEGPAANDSSKKLTTADVDVLGAESHEIVRSGDTVGADVDTEGDDDQSDSGKGCSSAATMSAKCEPLVEDHDWVPDHLAVCSLGGCSSEDAKEADDREDDWDDERLNILRTWLVGISREVGNVKTQSGVIAQDSVQVLEECPCEDRSADLGAASDHLTVADGAASSAQSVAEDGKEHDRSDDRLESEEVLDFRVWNAQEWQLKQEV